MQKFPDFHSIILKILKKYECVCVDVGVEHIYHDILYGFGNVSFGIGISGKISIFGNAVSYFQYA